MKHVHILIYALLVPILGVHAQEDKSFFSRTGLIGSVSATVMDKSIPFGGQVTGVYHFSDNFSAGIGSGFFRMEKMNTYDTVEANFSLVPVYADVRYYFLKSRIRPFAAVQVGYGILPNRTSSAEGYRYIPVYPPYAWTDLYYYDSYKSGGLYLNAEAGARYRLSTSIALFTTLSYSLIQVHGVHREGYYQNLPDENGQTRQIISYTEWDVMAYMNLFMLKVGIEIF